MKLMFATNDIKMNNQLIKKHGCTEADIKEIENIEELEDAAWEFAPSRIYIGDGIDTQKEKIEPAILKAIVNLHETFDVVYITPRKTSDPLVKKLIEKGFYQIIKDHDEPIPGNIEDVKRQGELDIPLVQDKKDTGAILDLPIRESISLSGGIELGRSIVTAIWSPIPNVGAGTFIRALAYELACHERSVLIIEADWQYAKLARATALTHDERHFKSAIRFLNGNNPSVSIKDYTVNARLAEEYLPHTHKQAKQRLKKIPSSLWVMARSATLSYEDEPELPDERSIDRLLFECKKAGFQNILVDLPSDPDNAYTMLTLLAADERFAVVDDTFTTSGLYKMAMEAFSAIELHSEQFELVITKIREGLTTNEIAEFYDKTPILGLPFCNDLALLQLELSMTCGTEYMEQIRSFIKRYGVTVASKVKKEKDKKVFSFL